MRAIERGVYFLTAMIVTMVVLFAIFGCAQHPPYICRQGTLPNGEPVLGCVPAPDLKIHRSPVDEPRA